MGDFTILILSHGSLTAVLLNTQKVYPVLDWIFVSKIYILDGEA